MRRRQLLALSGSLLAGGCLSASAPRADDPDTESGPTAATPETTNDPSTTETTVDSPDLSVELDALQPGLVTMTSPDSIGVSGHDDRYLLVDVSTAEDGRLPASGEFSLRVAEGVFDPMPVDEQWRFWRFERTEGLLYDRDAGGGLLVFELPNSPGASTTTASGTGSAESSANADDSAQTNSASEESSPVLTWPGGEWRPDQSLRDRLARPEPPLSVSFEVPAEIAPAESPTVSVTVDNEGDAAGRFVAGLNRIGPRVAYAPVERVSLLVPASESETWEFTDDSIASVGSSDEMVGDGDSDATYDLDWATGDGRESIRFVDD